MKGGTASRLPISGNVSRGYLSMVEIRLTGRWGKDVRLVPWVAMRKATMPCGLTTTIILMV
jgi:hypothetical protein